jgi:hypothetical protein
MNRELPSSSSFFTFEEKNQEMTTSREACRCLLHLRKKLRNDDEPFSSPSSTTLEKKKKMTMSFSIHRHFLHLREKNKETTTS